MDAYWWELPGPAGFLRSVWEDLRGGKSIVLALPATVPPGLRDGLAAFVRQAETWAWRDFPAGDGARSPAVLAEDLHRRFAPPKPGGVLSAGTLAGDPRLADTVIWVEGMTATAWPTWRAFLGQYARASQMRPEQGRGLFCVPLVGPVAGQAPQPDVALGVRRWRGIVSGLDVQLDLARRADDHPMPALHRRLARAVACDLAGSDAALARALTALDLRQLLEPEEFLRAEAARRGWDAALASRPRWEDGLLDGVNGEDSVHSAALALCGDGGALRRRIWRAEVAVLYPFLEEQRLRLLPRLRPYLRLPLETTYGTVDDVHELELGQLVYFLRGRNLPRDVWRLLTLLTDMRHALAHVRPVPVEYLFVEELLRATEGGTDPDRPFASCRAR
jgi:hypothetical protein